MQVEGVLILRWNFMFYKLDSRSQQNLSKMTCTISSISMWSTLSIVSKLVEVQGWWILCAKGGKFEERGSTPQGVTSNTYVGYGGRFITLDVSFSFSQIGTCTKNSSFHL